MSYAVYRKAGDRPGEIVRSGWGSYSAIAMQLSDEEAEQFALVSGDVRDPDQDYVTDMGIEPRPAMLLAVDKTAIVADGKDAATITRIPAGAKLVVNGASFDPVDGAASLTSTIAQTFEIVVSCWPYIDFPLTIEAE